MTVEVVQTVGGPRMVTWRGMRRALRPDGPRFRLVFDVRFRGLPTHNGLARETGPGSARVPVIIEQPTLRPDEVADWDLTQIGLRPEGDKYGSVVWRGDLPAAEASGATVTITRTDRSHADPGVTHPVPVTAIPTDKEMAVRADTVPVPARLLAALPRTVFDVG